MIELIKNLFRRNRSSMELSDFLGLMSDFMEKNSVKIDTKKAIDDFMKFKINGSIEEIAKYIKEK